MLGRKVATLINEFKTASSHSFTFNASGLTSGMYFNTLTVNGVRVQTKNIVMMK